jgi:hypothetical protein
LTKSFWRGLDRPAPRCYGGGMNTNTINPASELGQLFADSYTRINDAVVCNLMAAGVRSDVDIDQIFEDAVSATF